MKNVAIIRDKISEELKFYDGYLFNGKINGKIDIENAAPIEPQPRYVYSTNDYGTDIHVWEDGQIRRLAAHPEYFTIANGSYILTADEYKDLIAVHDAAVAKTKAKEEAEKAKWLTKPVETVEQRAERLRKAREWDDLYNESGEGYNPYREPKYERVPEIIGW